ncbi:hypothetical protein EMPS_05291 [Entomortierella parvispora]|uniref:Cyclin N-terminal domain-containing protein n=1 Tax=Entomortierella parvispora TaxID=205924 RepID=A0A9P3HAR6_9FUNG|nr:hypothetical protein EMPS_05291 [Entomortierella parvispora]
MLKATPPTSTQGQKSQQQTSVANDGNQKLNGSSLSLLKATSKVMAFLNGRKALSTNSSDEDANNSINNIMISQPLPQSNRDKHLGSNTTNTATALTTTSTLTKTVMMNRNSRRPTYTSQQSKSHNALSSVADQDKAIEQYRHLFQNRPINNLTKIPLPTTTTPTTTTTLTLPLTKSANNLAAPIPTIPVYQSGTEAQLKSFEKQLESAFQGIGLDDNNRFSRKPRRRAAKRGSVRPSSATASSSNATRRIQSGDIRQLGVNTNHTARLSSSRRGVNQRGQSSSSSSSSNSLMTTNTYCHHIPVPGQAHFGGVNLVDIVRGLESEFTLVVDSAEEEGSEDSQTCLLSEREISTDEEDDGTYLARSISSQSEQQSGIVLPPRPPSSYKNHILYQQHSASSSSLESSCVDSSSCSSFNTIEPASSASSSSSSSSLASSLASSPDSTLLNSSEDSGEDAVSLLVLPSPAAATVPSSSYDVSSASTVAPERLPLALEEPPQYDQHGQDLHLGIIPSPSETTPCPSVPHDDYNQQQILDSATSATVLSDLLREEEERQLEAERKSILATEVAATSAAADAAMTAMQQQQKECNSKKKSEEKPSLTLQTMTHNLGGIAPGALSAFESRPQSAQFSLTKCNSTSSLYIDSTMTKSDVDETLRAVATVLYDKILLSHKVNDCRTSRIINSSSYVPSERVVMTQADIFDFMRFIFDCGQNLRAENAIITLIYVERITELGNLSFHAINWRRLLLGALILSIKVWEDLAVFNSDVCAIFEGLNVKDVNALERFAMAKLQYNVSVKRSIYAAYFFRLRDVSEQEHNLHYGKLTLSMSQRDMQEHQQQLSQSSSRSGSLMTRNDSNLSYSSSIREGGSGLMGMATAINKVPVGPGYRKWTLKPLSVREADRLEARSALYCSNMRMEEQERKDVGCCWDEYSVTSDRASPAELSASMHTLASSSLSSSVSVSTSGNGAGSSSGMSTSTSTSSNATMISGSTADLAGTKGEAESGNSSNSSLQGSEPPRRVLRLKKSRSDFFFQNTTPASIM